MISGRNLLADRAASFSGIVGNEAALRGALLSGIRTLQGGLQE